MLRYDMKNNLWSKISGIALSASIKQPTTSTIRGLFKSNDILYATVDNNHSVGFQLYKYHTEEDKWEKVKIVFVVIESKSRNKNDMN